MRRRNRTEVRKVPIYKRCSRCGKRMPAGTFCGCAKARHQEYDRLSRDRKTKAFYVSSEWERARRKVLQLDGGIDVYLYMTKGEIVLADTVHHITPLREDWSVRCSINNLMSLNHDTHSMIEMLYGRDREGTEKKLKKMLELYREGQGGSEKF